MAPVRLLLSARCAADRTGSIMISISTELTLYGYIGAHPGCVVAQMVAIDAVLRHSRDPFAMGTRRWRPLRAQTRLSGRGGNAEYHGERSIPRRAACIATCVGFILIPEEMMLCSGCVGPCVPLWAKCPLYRLFHQQKGICLATVTELA